MIPTPKTNRAFLGDKYSKSKPKIKDIKGALKFARTLERDAISITVERNSRIEECDRLYKLLNTAWAVIANAGNPTMGDWNNMPEMWRKSAMKWKDEYFDAIAISCGWERQDGE